MSADARPLSPAQDRALTSLLLHGSPKRAAEAAAVNERTVRRWLVSEEFAAEHRRRARQLAREAATDLLAAQRQAVATLREGMDTGSPATKVRAARAVLELAARLWDDDVDQRLSELERKAMEWHTATGNGARLASTG